MMGTVKRIRFVNVGNIVDAPTCCWPMDRAAREVVRQIAPEVLLSCGTIAIALKWEAHKLENTPNVVVMLRES